MRGILSGVFGIDFFSALSVEKSFLVVFVEDLMVMGICFGSVLILPLFTFVRVLSFMISCVLIGLLGPGVFFGMVGCLPLLALMGLLLGLLRMMILPMLGWREFWARTLNLSVGSGFPLIVFLSNKLPLTFLIILDVWTDVSFVLDELSGVGVGGCGVLLSQSGGWLVWS